jgi:hypothetical protein
LSLDCMYSGENQDEDERNGRGAQRSEHGPNVSTPGRQPCCKLSGPQGLKPACYRP